jgi:hypothetical protein
MGSAGAARPAPRLSLEAHGTDVIESLEVLRHTPGQDGFEVAFALRPGTADVEWSARDHGFGEAAIYYVRLRQRREIRGRAVMAWSSPIWARRR